MHTCVCVWEIRRIIQDPDEMKKMRFGWEEKIIDKEVKELNNTL